MLISLVALKQVRTRKGNSLKLGFFLNAFFIVLLCSAVSSVYISTLCFTNLRFTNRCTVLTNTWAHVGYFVGFRPSSLALGFGFDPIHDIAPNRGIPRWRRFHKVLFRGLGQGLGGLDWRLHFGPGFGTVKRYPQGALQKS